MVKPDRLGQLFRPAPSPVLGTVFAGAGALSYGVTVVVGRSLAVDGFDAPTVLGFRFSVAALVLLVILAVRRRPLVPVPGERWAAVALGVAYAIESTFFFMALERGTAAAVAMLFYSYPVIVTLLDVLTGAGWPSPAVRVALLASAGGAALVAVAGADVSITGTGILLALASASTFAVYLLAGDRLIARTDAMITGAWVALFCAITHLVRGGVTGAMQSPAGHWPALIGNGVATASAFAFMFAGLRLLGPSRTAVVMTLEALFAILLGALFLDEPLGFLQLAGGGAILAGAMVIGTAGRPAEAPEIATEPP